MIVLHKVRVSFGGTVALRDLDLRLEPGIVGLFGQNGSGKSTLLRVLAGLLRPSAGHVTLDGVAWHRSRAEELRREVGYVGHSSGLYGRLTVRENLELGARLYDLAPERVDEVIGALALGTDADRRGGELSAGVARRAAVARAVLHEPRFLFLDEPYANLDDDAAEHLSDALRQWWRAGRVGIVATHGAKRVKAYAHAGVILKQGVIVSHRLRSEMASAS
ncbi:MAG: heme ABC exporter ATP-binding protein CcmA [Actinomycetota bacterium]